MKASRRDCKTSRNLHECSLEALHSTALLTADNPEHREVEGTWLGHWELGPKTDFMCTMAATAAPAAGRAKVDVFLEKSSEWRMGARAGTGSGGDGRTLAT